MFVVRRAKGFSRKFYIKSYCLLHLRNRKIKIMNRKHEGNCLPRKVGCPDTLGFG